ncbi:ABC transporter permease subunit [Methanogenium cariaci]|uniref:ABC transporter permease subunit n=1 Tax=Methanogenium cariaci TaxID=2197 RepID=UPI0024815612|nr:ABC transporter permease subunit [Methanogenium cariaci]
MIIGEPPEYPEQAFASSNSAYSIMEVSSSVSSDGEVVYEEPEPDPVWEEYRKKSDEYWQKRQSVSDIISLISPTMNLQTLSYKLLIPDYSKMMSMSFSPVGGDDGSEMPETDVFADIFKNIIALFAFPAAFLGLAYVRFMRMDVR